MFFQEIIRSRALKAAQKAEMKVAEGELRAAAEKLIKSPEFQEHVAALDSLFQPKFGRKFDSLDVFLVGTAGKNGLLNLNAFKETLADLAKGKRVSPQSLSLGGITRNEIKEVPYIGVSAEAAAAQVFHPQSNEPHILQSLKRQVNDFQGGLDFVQKEIAGKRTQGLDVKDVVFPPEWNDATFKAAHEHINAIATHIENSGLVKARDAYLAVNEAHAAAENAMPAAKPIAPARTLVQTTTHHPRMGGSPPTAEAETALF